MTNGYNSMGSAPAPASSKLPAEAAPDLLTRAFNEAVRPYTSRIDEMEGEIADLRAMIEDLHGQRRDVHAWIDKRGLRPGKLPLHLVYIQGQSTNTCSRRSTKHCRTDGRRDST